jgi:hypothetical protein
MKSKNALCGVAMAVVLQLGVLAGSAQTNIYLFSGSLRNITLPPGTYIITAYGAPGGGSIEHGSYGGLGAEMSGEFYFSTSTTLTLLVGGSGGINAYVYTGGGGGGGSFVVESNTPLVIAGGGGGAGFDGGGGEGGSGTVSNNGGNGALPRHIHGVGYGYGGAGGGGGDGGFVSFGGGYSGGGGGFLGNGGGTNDIVFAGGFSFENGGAGGTGYAGGYSGGGGFGGGGGGSANGTVQGYSGGGGGGGYSGGGGGDEGGGGGGGSIIDSSAIAILTEISGIASPDDPRNYYNPGNGEIIITAVPTPLIITTAGAAFGFTNGVFGFSVIGPVGSNVVIQTSMDLHSWIPLQTNLLGSGPLYFSDPQSTTNVQRFYRAQLSPAFTVGGTLTGLPAGDTVTLQDNGSDNLTLSTNGTFTFPTALPNGHAYSVTVSGTSGGTEIDWPVTANCSGIISGTNVTNVAVQCTRLYTGNLDVDMYNAAVADGTDHGGVPAVMYTQDGGLYKVTANGFYSHSVCLFYGGYVGGCKFTTIVAPGSCSSTTFPVGTYVIQFGNALFNCGPGPYGY